MVLLLDDILRSLCGSFPWWCTLILVWSVYLMIDLGSLCDPILGYDCVLLSGDFVLICIFFSYNFVLLTYNMWLIILWMVFILGIIGWQRVLMKRSGNDKKKSWKREVRSKSQKLPLGIAKANWGALKTMVKPMSKFL